MTAAVIRAGRRRSVIGRLTPALLKIARAVALATVTLAYLAGCGDESQTTATQPPRHNGDAGGGGCPVEAGELSKITGMDFELATQRDAQPMEALESVKSEVCIYTGPADQYGDPLVFRTDTVSESDAATVRVELTRICEELGGSMRAATAGDDGSVCERDGTIVDGLVRGGRVSVALVNADKDVAKRLSPKFDHILGAVR